MSARSENITEKFVRPPGEGIEQIKLIDVQAELRAIEPEIREAIDRVLASGIFIKGDEVKQFEEEFARYCGTRFAVGASSGTAALHLALLACEVGTGHEVITTPHTFIATAEAIGHCGAKPVFVDVEEGTGIIDAAKLEDAITEATKAIVVVHIYGQPADMGRIVEIARRHHVALIEDCAQAHGAEYQGKRVGGFGDAGCYSFFPAKNLGALGDAGMVVSNSETVARTCRVLSDHGREAKYTHSIEGYNYRLDPLQAAVLRAKLRHLDEWNRARRERARLYRTLLRGSRVKLLHEKERTTSACHLFVIRVEKRDALRDYLAREGIETGIHYPVPLHLQPAYKHLGYREGDFPVAEAMAREVVSLPLYPALPLHAIERICALIRRFYSEK
jgi:dTDP-4-amino-4,6-dideoxygalactose transaminase